MGEDAEIIKGVRLMDIKDINYIRDKVIYIVKSLEEDDGVKHGIYHLGMLASFLGRFIPEEVDNK